MVSVWNKLVFLKFIIFVICIWIIILWIIITIVRIWICINYDIINVRGINIISIKIISIGIISIIGVKELLNGSFLAKVINLFIAVYWISRILIQFFYFDTSAAPKGFIYKLGEIILVAVFLFLAIAYSLAFLFNITEWEFSIWMILIFI